MTHHDPSVDPTTLPPVEPIDGETVFMRKLRLALEHMFVCRLFRNNVGRAWVGEAQVTTNGIFIRKPYQIAFGLCPGSHDLIGITSVVVTEEMVGKRIGVFTSIETKAAGKAATYAQNRFKEMVVSLGGIAGVARCMADALDLMKQAQRNQKLEAPAAPAAPAS